MSAITAAQRSDMIGALIAHQRVNIESCGCGWSDLGRSHAAHVANAILAALGITVSDETPDDVIERAARVLYDCIDLNRAVLDDAREIARALAAAGLLADEQAIRADEREKVARRIEVEERQVLPDNNAGRIEKSAFAWAARIAREVGEAGRRG